MSECVVRMKKYGNCLDCDLHQIVYGDSDADTDVYCFKEKRYVGKRFGPLKDLTSPSWCPIICSLPEVHGPLVDSEEDASKYITVWDCNCSEFGRQTVMAVEDLQYLPIIVPAERSEE